MYIIKYSIYMYIYESVLEEFFIYIYESVCCSSYKILVTGAIQTDF